MSMEFEDGSLVDFYHVGTIDYEGQWYIFFQPSEPKEGIDPAELVVFRISGSGKDETLIPVDDEKTLSEVYEVFLRENDASCSLGSCDKCEKCGDCGLKKEKKAD